MNEMNKYLLDYNVVFPYVKEQLESGQELAKTILKNCDFKKGIFYTFLPNNAALNRIKFFTEGGIIPQEKEKKLIDVCGSKVNYQEITSTEDKLVDFVFQFLNQFKEGSVILEDILKKKKHKLIEIKSAKLCFYNQEVYYILTNANSFDTVEDTVKNTVHVWQFVCALIPQNIEFQEELSDSQISELSCLIKYLIVVAYDGESFIFWERNS